jgi:hypothetical protein
MRHVIALMDLKQLIKLICCFAFQPWSCSMKKKKLFDFAAFLVKHGINTLTRSGATAENPLTAA